MIAFISKGKDLFVNRLRIPTLLGLSILMLGIAAGVYLVAREQNFYIKASPTLIPQNLNITNIDDSQVAITWQTSAATPVFVTYAVASANPNPIETGKQTATFGNQQTALDDRDTNVPNPRITHYVTLKNLLPKTTYQYKIISGKFSSDISKFTTAAPASSQNGFNPVIGSVFDGNKPLDDAVAYLAISKAVTQSAVIKNMGNFVIPLSSIKKSDLSDNFPLEEGTIAKITIISDKGESSALFKVESSAKPLPPLHLGQNLDLTTLTLKAKEASQSGQDLTKHDLYDLNGDGSVNTADYAIVLKNFGKKGTNIKGDLNSDGVVDQKDLSLISKQLIHE